MSVREVKKGSVDISVVIRIVDSTDGTPETGVVYNTSGIDLWYRRELAAKVSITEATLAALTTAHTDGGFLHIGDGYYRLDLPDAAVASGADGVMVAGTVTGMVVIGCYIPLVDNIESDTYARIGAPAGASVSADVAAVNAKTTNLPASPAAVGSAMTLTSGERTSIGTAVWATTTRLLTAGTNIVLAKGTGVTGFNDLSAAQVNTEADQALADVGLTTTITGRIDASISGIPAAVWAAGTRTLTSFGTLAADVWVVATRTLTSGANIVLAKGTGITGFNDLSAAQVNAEADTALADYDPPTKAELDTAVAGIPAAVWAAGTRTLTSFGTLVSDIWAAATRTLSSGANIVLAKGTGVTGFNDLSAAQVNAEVDQALADVGLTTTVTGRVDAAISTRATASSLATTDGKVDLIKAKTDGLPASPASEGNVSAVGSAVVAVGNAVANLNDVSKAEVQSAAEAALAAYGAATADDVSGLNNLDSTQVQAAAAAALAAYDPPTKAEVDAAVSPLATSAALATTDARLDSEIPAILTHLTDIKGAGFNGTTDSLEAIRDQGDAEWAAESTGNGDMLIDHNYGGSDAMRFTWGGVGVDGARIRAYVKADYVAGNFNVVGSTTTNDDGRWLLPLALDDGITYTLVITAEGYETKTHEVTV